MSAQQFRPIYLPALLAVSVTLAALATGCRHVPKPTPVVRANPVNPLAEAILRVEEERGEPVGKEATILIPPQLKHYPDRRRFLAVQVAEWRRTKYQLPRDYVALVDMIGRGEFIELPPLGEDYVLYAVGESANDGPFHHYDRAAGELIPLFASLTDYEAEQGRLAEQVNQRRAETGQLVTQLQQIPRRERRPRAELQKQIAERRKQLAGEEKWARTLAAYYRDPARRARLLSEYSRLAGYAARLDGEKFDLQAPADRKRLKMRLLSHLRPQARGVLLEIARAYHGQFGRRLPVTSLVRTEAYQIELRASNKNATRIVTPPHTTGLAFDIYNGYMTAAEQDLVMAEIARLEAAGRVEALRENRDHIHVFAFAAGRPPADALIADALKRRN